MIFTTNQDYSEELISIGFSILPAAWMDLICFENWEWEQNLILNDLRVMQMS